ncbi:MAG: PA2779 family protein [Candidatus Rokuibacteriota bacterium]
MMVRDRLLSYRWLVYGIVVWGMAVASVPQVADAAPLPPARAGSGDTDLDTLRHLLERRIVRDRLAAVGVSPADAEAALQRLSPEERSELATRAQELEAGGNGVAFLAVAIIIGLVVILILELLGRRVISRP